MFPSLLFLFKSSLSCGVVQPRVSRRLVESVSDLSEDDLVIVLISGGGSSLLSLPAPGVSRQQKLEVIEQLARAGADITELNTVRSVLQSELLIETIQISG